MGHTTEKDQETERAKEACVLSTLQLSRKVQEQNYPYNNLTTLAAWTIVSAAS